MIDFTSSDTILTLIVVSLFLVALFYFIPLAIFLSGLGNQGGGQ